MQPKALRWLVLALTGTLLLSGLLLLAGFLLPYEQLKPLADMLARDGSLERFTPGMLAQLKPGLLITALICLTLAAWVFLARGKMSEQLDGLRHASPAKALGRDLKELGAALQEEMHAKRELGLLAIVTLLAAMIRGCYLSQPMQHDEAYTFIAFASRPFWIAISDYSLPNNHVFHTLLVYLAYHLLGIQPWIIRLPAYLAGIAIIPLAYGVGAAFYDRKVGLLSAGLVASSPLLIDYSGNARGYAMICAFTLLAVILAAFVKNHRNSFAWMLLALAGALGFYTIPIMLYPFGMVAAWLVLSYLLGDTPGAYGRSFWSYLVISCLLLAGLVALLYMPIFAKSGIGAIVNNSYVRPDEVSGLLEQLGSRITSTAQQWTAGIPLGIGTLSLIGFAASLALHRRISKQKVPLQVAAVLWILVAIALQRVAPLARVWMFLLPLYIIWATAGLVGVLRLAIPLRFHPQARWVALLLSVCIPGLVLLATIPRTASMREAPGAEEGITLYLQEHIRAGDLVVAQSPVSTPLEYYFLQYGLPPESFDYQAPVTDKLWVVASRRYDQTVDSVLRRRGLERYNPDAPVIPAYQYKHIAIYELMP